MSKIVLVRHGESEWNKKGLWTGWRDISLSKNGVLEAVRVAHLIRDIKFDYLFSSDLIRAIDTLEIIKKELNLTRLSINRDHALKERHYGEFTGRNKWQIKKLVGEKRFKQIRRGWNHPITGGETLKDVYLRVVPYFKRKILPLVKKNKNILISTHGNTIRALTKHIESLSAEEITEIEFATGEAIIYELHSSGKVINKERRKYEKVKDRN